MCVYWAVRNLYDYSTIRAYNIIFGQGLSHLIGRRILCECWCIYIYIHTSKLFFFIFQIYTFCIETQFYWTEKPIRTQKKTWHDLDNNKLVLVSKNIWHFTLSHYPNWKLRMNHKYEAKCLSMETFRLICVNVQKMGTSIWTFQLNPNMMKNNKHRMPDK